MDSSILCSICLQKLEEDQTVSVLEKGLQTLIKKSKEKNDDKWKFWVNQKQYIFHVNCRKKYAVSSSKSHMISSPVFDVSSASTSSVAQSNDGSSDLFISDSTSSTTPPQLKENFDFEQFCFICKKKWDRINKPGSIVQDDNTKNHIIHIAANREDDLAMSIISLLETTDSLVDSRARYHSACYKNFMAPFYKKPQPFKPIDNDIKFNNICNYIETSGVLKFRISLLKSMMGEDKDNQIETRTLLRHLKKKYGDDIFILKRQGKEAVIYYKHFDVAKICSDWYGNSEGLSEAAKKTIITVCAEILQNEVKEAHYKTDNYPQPNKFLNNVVSDIPPLLTYFLQKLLINHDNTMVDECPFFPKIDNIGHSIISALRPKSFISCLQLAVGTYIYRKTGSKLVINLLNKLGVCSSYNNIQLHEASSIMHSQTTTINDAFVQYVFDNTDHNVCTLDGRETFHCLGGIAVYTPGSSVSYEGPAIKCKKMPAAATIACQSVIPDTIYDDKWPSGLKNVMYENPNKFHLGVQPIISPTYATFLAGRCFKIQKLPMWRGFMEKLNGNVNDILVSHVKCLPFINRPPSQFSTLNTALHFAASESRKIGQKTIFVTFDQPLYLKARNIVAQLVNEDLKYKELKNVVVRLGGFHLLMSYLGAIGSIMADSGLEELWSVAYASESVKKMINGHAFSRAIRAHILTFTALGMMICKSLDEYNQFENIIKNFFVKWPETSPSMKDCESNNDINTLTNLLTSKLICLATNGPTAKLWTQYFNCVLIALQFIEAERLGNWKLHLHSIKKMLPIFHAAGHYPYAKCAHLYLQDMSKLDTWMDDQEYEDFTRNGFFTIRRTQKAWSGVWSDMTIEQTLNRYFGTDLKHGRGVTPSVVARYLSSMPSAFNIMSSLEQYCSITTVGNEQHVDLSSSRINRDEADLEKFLFWLNEHQPFMKRDYLISLSTGIIGGPNIDCHLAFEKGQKGVKAMIGKIAENISLTQINKVKTLATARKGMIVNHNDFASINPSLLFQRIAMVVEDNTDMLRTALQYELSPYPMSLFDETGFMRKSTKAELYNVFEPFIEPTVFLTDSCFVIDGGWLVHQIYWPHGKTFQNICEIYLSFIKKHFPAATVVFDGYSNEIVAVKTYERFRRQEKNFAPDLIITLDMMVSLTREKFLANIANKQMFIQLLSAYLRKSGIVVAEADGDADRLIVQTALRLNNELNKSIVVVGNDVDLLILLIDQTPNNEIMYFYKMGSSKKENQLFSTLNNRKLKNFILFAHAFAGCDTTSALFKKGKKRIITLLEKEPDLVPMIRTYYEPNQTIDVLYEVGEKIIFQLYSSTRTRHQSSTISDLRYELFNTSVYQYNEEVSLAVLPPTTSALQEHVKKVYYQVQEWVEIH